MVKRYYTRSTARAGEYLAIMPDVVTPSPRRVRRRLAEARSAQRYTATGVRARALRRFTKWGVRGAAVGVAAAALIGTARALRRSKRSNVYATNGQIDTRTLSSGSLTEIAAGTDIDQRERHNVQLSGYKVRGEVVNLLGSPLYVNIAIVHNRDTGNTFAHEFFRNSANVRGVDFSTALSSLEMHGLPMNTDKFAVIKHERFLLAPNASTATGAVSNGQNDYYTTFDEYVKVNRNLQYDGPSSGEVDAASNIHLLWWCDEMATAGGSTPVPSSCTFNWNVIAFHHDS